VACAPKSATTKTAAPSFEYIKLFKQQQIAAVAAAAAETKAFDSA
jgi:hypothetical protein